MNVAVLFARSDSVYKSIPGCDVYDIERDARTYRGPLPVVAHPPCRAWGRLRHFAKPRRDEKELALFALDAVRIFGGVLEHPASSSLWIEAKLPKPGSGQDDFRGWSIELPQKWFGHKAEKNTWLYVCGIDPKNIPSFPISLNEASHTVGKWSGRDKTKQRPELSKKDREATPPMFANWLVDLARRCQ